jgi:hypothetical protein
MLLCFFGNIGFANNKHVALMMLKHVTVNPLLPMIAFMNILNGTNHKMVTLSLQFFENGGKSEKLTLKCVQIGNIVAEITLGLAFDA